MDANSEESEDMITEWVLGGVQTNGQATGWSIVNKLELLS